MLFVCYPKCSTCMKAKKWLEEKEIELKQKESAFTGAKYNLYSHINVSLKTMNIVVAVIAVALVVAIAAGVIYR